MLTIQEVVSTLKNNNGQLPSSMEEQMRQDIAKFEKSLLGADVDGDTMLINGERYYINRFEGVMIKLSE